MSKTKAERSFCNDSRYVDMIVPGSASQALAAAVAKAQSIPLATVHYQQFPDGERLCRVADFDSDTAVIIGSAESDRAWIELLQLQDAVREAGAERVVTVIPYMSYARQDQAFKFGEPNSARAMARAVSTTTDHIILIDPHEDNLDSYFDVPVNIYSTAHLLADALPTTLCDPLFLAPDAGAVELATRVRDSYGSGKTDYFLKTRHSGEEVDLTTRDTELSDRDVVVVDDIIATGSTLSQAVDLLNDAGASRVFATCIHPLLVQNARTKLETAGVEQIIATDTLERDVSVVSAAPVIGAFLEGS
jgi:ribose-phosphate pyrophosphokinase